MKKFGFISASVFCFVSCLSCLASKDKALQPDGDRAKATSKAKQSRRGFVHPWGPLDVYDGYGYKKSPEKLEKRLIGATRKVMGMSDKEIRELISPLTPFVVCGCPHCRGGAQETSVGVWSIDDPWRIKCKHCGMVFPNKKYPLGGAIKVTNPLGETQTYRFYDSGDEKRRYYFLGCCRYKIKWYMAVRAYELGMLYHITKDARYAHKAAVIIHRFAEVYPRWPVWGMVGNYTNWYKCHERPPYPFQSGKWGRWNPNNLPMYPVLAYDLIYNSGEIEKLGPKAKEHIEKEFFAASVDFVRKDYSRYLGASGMWTAACMIAIGRTTGNPDYVHEGVARFRDALKDNFFYDGMYSTGSLGYHFQMLRELGEPIPVASGYSDPPGYIHPKDKLHFKDLDVARDVPMLGRAKALPEKMVMPDGRYAPVHDSFSSYTPGTKRYVSKPLKVSRPVLIPGAGYAILGRGKGKNQLQAHLNFEYMGGHCHLDMLNLLLYARGKEFLPDLGYSHTKLRVWSASTLAHNTVLLDGKSQTSDPKSRAFGDLLLWEVGHPGVQVVEARGQRAYKGSVPGVKMYRRLLAVVDVSEEDAYVVDIFRVIGGTRQTWVAHGSADEDQTVECSFPTKPIPGTLLGPDTVYKAEQTPQVDAESIAGPIEGLVDHLRRGKPEDDYTFTFRFRKENEPRLRVHMIRTGEETVTTARAPSIRRSAEDNRKVDGFKMPLVLVETRGKAGQPLARTYVAVWEPYADKPFIESVKPLTVSGKSLPAGLVIKLTNGRTDYILSTIDGVSPPLREVKEVPDLAIRGRFGMITEKSGKVVSGLLIGGTSLKKGGTDLRLNPDFWSGEVTAVRRKDAGDAMNGFVTSSALPRKRLVGLTLLIQHGNGSTNGYRISRVSPIGRGSMIEVDGEPGWTIERKTGKARLVNFPSAELPKPHNFIILNSLSKDFE